MTTNTDTLRNKIISKSITTEAWREYDWSGRVYRIDKPKTLFFRENGSTHRIVDKKGVVHCIPAPGIFGCVLRWQNKNTSQSVNF